jgi:hypothetical protein
LHIQNAAKLHNFADGLIADLLMEQFQHTSLIFVFSTSPETNLQCVYVYQRNSDAAINVCFGIGLLENKISLV